MYLRMPKTLIELCAEFWPIDRASFTRKFRNPVFINLSVGGPVGETELSSTRKAVHDTRPLIPKADRKQLLDAEVIQLPLVVGASLTIGRGNRADVQLDDQCISKVHLRVLRSEDGWAVEDCGSTNGSYVDGQTLNSGQRLSLRDRSMVHLGLNACCMFVQPASLHAYLGMVSRTSSRHSRPNRSSSSRRNRPASGSGRIRRAPTEGSGRIRRMGSDRPGR